MTTILTTRRSKGRIIKIVHFDWRNGGGDIQFQVFKEGQDKPYYRRGLRIKEATKETYLDFPQVWSVFRSIKKNIIPVDPDNIDKSDIEDYGIANGWGDGDKHPRMEKYMRDRKRNPNLCVYEYEVSLGRCYTKTYNITYGYCYSVDSSD